MTTSVAGSRPQARGVSPVPARRKRRFRPGLIALVVVAILLTVAFIAPLLWMLSTSFKSNAEAVALPPHWWPQHPTIAAYESLLTGSQAPVLRWFANSLIAAILHSALTVAIAAPAAYALARFQFRFRNAIFGIVIATLFVPSFIFLIPNYLIVDQLGWLDTRLALIVPGAASAFGVFFLRQLFLGLPPALEEAARIDGANRWQIFTRIALPLARPGLATLVVISFLTNWNDFLWPVYVLFNPQQLTLPAGLSTLQDADATNYPVLMAGAVIASVPILILFVLAQRYIIEGVAQSGVKG